MKHSFLKLVTVLCIAAASFSSCSNGKCAKCEANAINLDSVKATIASSNQLFTDAFTKADSSLLIERYTTDGCILAPNMPALCGTQQIAGFYRAAYDQMGMRNIKLTTTQVYGSGAYVTEEGTYELFAAENKSIDKGKFLVLWKKTDVGWKMYRDIFNSDYPIPSSAK